MFDIVDSLKKLKMWCIVKFLLDIIDFNFLRGIFLFLLF